MQDSFGKEIPKTAFIIRATEVGEYLNCPRAWLFQSQNGLNLQQIITNPNLRFGTCWHKALEEYYWNYHRGKTLSMEYRFKYALEAFTEEHTHEVEKIQEALGDGVYDPDIQQQLEEHLAMGRALLEGYVQWSNEEAEPSDSELQIEAVERRFVVPVPTLNGYKSRAYLAVKLDGVAHYNNALYVFEHKTMSKSSNVSNPNNLPLDIQMGLQMLALQAVYKKPVHGAIYNLTRKQVPSPRVKNPIYGRHIVRRSGTELTHLQQFLYKTYQAMRYTAKYQNIYTAQYNPQMVGKCSWGCAVRPICEAINRGEDVEFLITALMKPREKDFLEMLEEEMNDD